MRSWERRVAMALAALGVLLLFAAGGLVLATGEPGRGAAQAALAGLALALASLLLDPALALELARRRETRFGALSLLVSAGAVGALGLVDVLASRSPAQLDLTRAGYYTLAPQSLLVVRRLDSDLVVTGFFRPDQKEQRRRAEALLALYQEQNPHFKVHWVDPDQDLAEAKRLGVDIAGDLVLEYKDRPPVVLTLASQTESDITGALLRLESNRTPTVCWAQGDGERSLSSQDSQVGYSAAAELLRQRNYATRELLLSQQPQVPAGCDVLAIVGPTQPLSVMGQRAVADYLTGGGKLLLALGPWEGPAVDGSVNLLLQPYGVAFSGGLVVEGDPDHRAVNDPTDPVVDSWGSSPIARDLSGRAVIFPHPTSISGDAAGADAVDLAVTTARSYLVARPRPVNDLGRGPKDKDGPFTIMQTLEVPRQGNRRTRIVLVGSPDLAENLALSADTANQDLLLGTFDWLSQQEDLIAVSAKPPRAEALPVTQQELYLHALVTLVAVPGLFAAIGLGVYLRRRRHS